MLLAAQKHQLQHMTSAHSIQTYTTLNCCETVNNTLVGFVLAASCTSSTHVFYEHTRGKGDHDRKAALKNFPLESRSKFRTSCKPQPRCFEAAAKPAVMADALERPAHAAVQLAAAASPFPPAPEPPATAPERPAAVASRLVVVASLAPAVVRQPEPEPQGPAASPSNSAPEPPATASDQLDLDGELHKAQKSTTHTLLRKSCKRK